MPEEEIQHQPEKGDEKKVVKPAKKKHTLLIVIICVVAGIGMLGLGGYLGYRYYQNQQQVKKEKQKQAAERKAVEEAIKNAKVTDTNNPLKNSMPLFQSSPTITPVKGQ